MATIIRPTNVNAVKQISPNLLSPVLVKRNPPFTHYRPFNGGDLPALKVVHFPDSSLVHFKAEDSDGDLVRTGSPINFTSLEGFLSRFGKPDRFRVIFKEVPQGSLKGPALDAGASFELGELITRAHHNPFSVMWRGVIPGVDQDVMLGNQLSLLSSQEFKSERERNMSEIPDGLARMCLRLSKWYSQLTGKQL